MSKYQEWFDGLPKNTRKWMEKQPIYYDRDLIKAAAFGAVIGAITALVLYFEFFYQPVVPVFRPVIG